MTKLDSIVNHENFETFFCELSYQKYFKDIFQQGGFRVTWDYWNLRGEVALYFDAEKKPALKKFFKNCYPEWIDPFNLYLDDLVNCLDNYEQSKFEKLITKGKTNLFKYFFTLIINEVDHKAKYGC